MKSSVDKRKRLCDESRRMEKVQALIVGSGYRGSICAARLGQAGVKTRVLERFAFGRPMAREITADGNHP